MAALQPYADEHVVPQNFLVPVTDHAAGRFHAMPHTPDHIEPDSEAVSEPTHDGAPSRSRTAAAGREFLDALGGDIAFLSRKLAARATRLRRNLAAARLRRSLAAARRQHEAPPPPVVRRRPRRGWVGTGGHLLLRLVMWTGAFAVVATIAVFAAMLWALNGLPLDKPMNEAERPSFVLEAANGEPLGRVGPMRVGDVALKDISPTLVNAVLSIEDRRFRYHLGVDPIGVLRAAHRNEQAGGVVQGGSTITQQLVKMRYVGDDRTYKRKVREALTALWLETHLGKDEILTRYLNGIYLGAGAYGVAAASQLYFNKRPSDLTLPEAAMLAGLIKAPTQYNPLAHQQEAQARAAAVLDAMVDNGVIDATRAAGAKAHPAVARLTPQTAPASSWFADWVGTQATALARSNTSTMRVRTTLMPEVQRLAQDTLNNVLARDGRRMGVSQGALVAMRPDGAVVAMVGGRDYGASQFNRAVDAKRQPGSSFKLFVYMTALRKGYSPLDIVDASPIDIKGWEPENYGGGQYGRMTLADAFARSVNTAAVRLAMQVGLNDVIATARDLGIDSPLSPTPSLALGAYGVSLLDMTGAFASVKADRKRLKPWGIAAIGAANGANLQAAQPLAPTQTLEPYQRPMIELLRGVVVAGTARGAALPGFAAGKTGTSQDYRDAWFIGFNDSLIVGVWLGNDDNSPTHRVTGGSLPATIWRQFVSAATPLVAQQPQVAAAPVPQQPSNPPIQPSDELAARATQVTQAPPVQAGSAMCDVQACSSMYRSFRASDCTYQPYWGGGRQVCGMNGRQWTPMARTSVETTGAGVTSVQGAPVQGAAAQCNIEACSRFYSSFNPSDCTYQPFGSGARQLCER
jgi:1A family penicillin-binding protein